MYIGLYASNIVECKVKGKYIGEAFSLAFYKSTFCRARVSERWAPSLPDKSERLLGCTPRLMSQPDSWGPLLGSQPFCLRLFMWLRKALIIKHLTCTSPESPLLSPHRSSPNISVHNVPFGLPAPSCISLAVPNPSFTNFGLLITLWLYLYPFLQFLSTVLSETFHYTWNRVLFFTNQSISLFFTKFFSPWNPSWLARRRFEISSP